MIGVGLVYGGHRFYENFPEYAEKYGLQDMYSAGFYPYATLEEYWAYWSRHIEKVGGKYERQGDYILPCLTVPPEAEKTIGVFGQRHLWYLREYRKVTYINLLTSGRIHSYLTEIDGKAQERFERLVEGMKQAQVITEQLKVETPYEQHTGLCNGDGGEGNRLRIGVTHKELKKESRY